MSLSTTRQISLKTRMALVMAFVFIGFAGALALLGLRYFESEFRDNLHSAQFALATALAGDIDDKLRLSHQALIAAARQLPRGALRHADKAQQFLDQQGALHSIFDNGLFLISSDGKIVAESPYRTNRRRGRDVSFREFFQVTAATRQPYISRPYESTFSPGTPALMMTAPLLDERGAFLGLLEGSFNLLGKNFLADLQDIRIDKTGYVSLLTSDRVLISHHESERIMKPTARPGENLLLDRAIAGFEGSDRTRSSRGTDLLTSFKHVPATGWVLGVNLPVAEAEAPLRKAQTYFFLAAAGGSLLVLLLVWLLMKRSLAPLETLSRHVETLSGKEGEARQLPLRIGGEIGTLVQAFNTMVDTLDKQQQTLQKSEARFRSLTEMSADWYWEQDAQLRFTQRSKGLTHTYVPSAIGKTRWELPMIGVSEADLAAHRKALECRQPFRDFTYQIESESGDLRTFSISGAPIFGKDGEFLGYRGIGSDITDRRASEQQIEFLAYHDSLTGLPNRLLVRDRFEQAVAQAERSGSRVALIYLDLDNFKTINDTLGHAAGDELLKETARRLRECVRDTDTISRQGGDEFLVVLCDIPDADVISTVLVKLMAKLQEPFQFDSHDLSTSASVGVAIYPDDGQDYDTLRKKADMAMYRSKEMGRNAYHFFDQAMDIEANEHLRIRNGLRRAIERDELVMHYQPQIDLRSGTVIGVEALLRWQHPDFGLVEPARFIRIAEESGLIVPMSDWALRQACHQAAQWQRNGMPPLSMAVNLSGMQFKRGDVEQAVLDALHDAGLAPQWLELEMTESILLENTESVQVCLQRLKRLGVRLAIDDFGTGYSSLSYLKRFDIDKLKIDQSFVRDLATDADDATIVRAVIQMAHSLNLKTLAEGVETEEMLAQLRAFGCDEVQGYHFARPMPAGQIERLLQTLQIN